MNGRTIIESVRGPGGLLNAIVFNQPKGGFSDQGKAWDVCFAMKRNGLLAEKFRGETSLWI
jgi:hypothetical protein